MIDGFVEVQHVGNGKGRLRLVHRVVQAGTAVPEDAGMAATSEKDAVVGGTNRLSPDLWRQLLKGEDVFLEAVGVALGEGQLSVTLHAWPKAHPEARIEMSDVIRFRVINLIIDAAVGYKDAEGVARVVAARSDWTGKSPKQARVLLTGQYGEVQFSPHVRKVRGVSVGLSALGGLTGKGDFPLPVEWSVDCPEYAAWFLSNDPASRNVGTVVALQTDKLGFLTVTAKVGPVEEKIRICVASLQVTSAPEYFFGAAKSCVPLEFFVRTDRANTSRPFVIAEVPDAEFGVDRCGLSWQLYYKELPAEEDETPDYHAVGGLSGTASRMPLEMVAPSWDWHEGKLDAEGKPVPRLGSGSAYCATSRPAALAGSRMKNAGVSEDLLLDIEGAFYLKLSEDEQTNIAWLVGSVAWRSPEGGDIMRLYDGRWPVLEIGKRDTQLLVSTNGESYFTHLSTNESPAKRFSGIGMEGHLKGTWGLFSAGQDKVFTGEERYYLPSDKWSLVAGFNEDGDRARAGIVQPLTDKEFKVEATLFDDSDGPWLIGGSDEKEEWKAVVAEAGIGANITVCYPSRNEAYFKNIYDLRRTRGVVQIFALCEASWTVAMVNAHSSASAALANTLLGVSGIGLSGVGVLVAMTLPSGGTATVVGICLGVASVTLGLVGLAVNDIDKTMSYHGHKSVAFLFNGSGIFEWSDEPLQHKPTILTGADGTIVFGDNGCWSGSSDFGKQAFVGSQIRTQWAVNLSAKNSSYEYDPTDVRASAFLRGVSGDSERALNRIVYEWQDVVR